MNGDQPAFPQNNYYDPAPTRGMTYRQWLAGMALQGWIACSETSGSFEYVAKSCWQYADALIAAENVKEGK